MKPGDIVKRVEIIPIFPVGWIGITDYPIVPLPEALGIYLGEVVNQKTGEAVCAEVMWFPNNEIRICSFAVIEKMEKAA